MGDFNARLGPLGFAEAADSVCNGRGVALHRQMSEWGMV